MRVPGGRSVFAGGGFAEHPAQAGAGAELRQCTAVSTCQLASALLQEKYSFSAFSEEKVRVRFL